MVTHAYPEVVGICGGRIAAAKLKSRDGVARGGERVLRRRERERPCMCGGGEAGG